MSFSVLQAGLEGEPTWKTPRVPPAQSPGITPLSQEADSRTSTTKAAPAVHEALQLDVFVHSYVESIVSEAKSELLAEARHTSQETTSIQRGVPDMPASPAFTQGSSAGSTATPHKGRSARAGPHRAQVSPVQASLAQQAASRQRQLGPDVPVPASKQAAPSLTVQGPPSSSQAEVQPKEQVDDAVSSSLQAGAESELGAPSKGDSNGRTGGSSGQAEKHLIEVNLTETASRDKQTSKEEAVSSGGTEADADATKMVSQIVQDILHAVSEPTHADQVRIYSLLFVWSSISV